MAIQFELYKSPARKDEEDKELYHARVVNFQHHASGKGNVFTSTASATFR